jgi:hypothetical protein
VPKLFRWGHWSWLTLIPRIEHGRPTQLCHPLVFTLIDSIMYIGHMAQLSFTAIYRPSSKRCINLFTALPQRSIYTLVDVYNTKELFNSSGLSERFVVAGLVSQEEEEREPKSSGSGNMMESQRVCFLWPWWSLMCFPMPPIPIILKHSFLFLFGSHNHFTVKLKFFIHIFTWWHSTMVRREKEEMRVKEQPVWEHAGKLKLWLY